MNEGLTAMRTAAAGGVGDVLLVDVLVGAEGWAEDLPPCPAATAITVVFSDPDTEVVHGEAVARLGYRLAGVLARPGPAVAQLAVPRAAAARHPDWWRALLHRADRVWDTALGPVALSCQAALASHGLTG